MTSRSERPRSVPHNLRSSQQIFNDRRLVKKQKQLEYQRQMDEKLEQDYSEACSVDVSYEKLRKEGRKQWIVELQQIQETVNMLRQKLLKQEEDEPSSEYTGLKNLGQQAVAEILLELDLIVEIGSYNLNDLLKEAKIQYDSLAERKKKQQLQCSMPKFIENIEEMKQSPIQMKNDIISYNYSSSVKEQVKQKDNEANNIYLRQQFSFGSNLRPSHLVLSISDLRNGMNEATESIKFQFIEEESLSCELEGASLDSKASPQQSLKDIRCKANDLGPQLGIIKFFARPYKRWGKILSMDEKQMRIAFGFEQQIRILSFEEIVNVCLVQTPIAMKVETIKSQIIKVKLQTREQYQKVRQKVFKGKEQKQESPYRYSSKPILWNELYYA